MTYTEIVTGPPRVIEVLRRTGVRIEELLELTHLSLRQYQAPPGEMVMMRRMGFEG